MRPIQITLPPGEAIHCAGLLRTIAVATYPTLETSLGVDCILEKLVTRAHVAPDFEMPFKLTEQDRLDIAPLLKDLPELHGEMTELEVSQFEYAYASHPNRLSWTPCIVNPGFVEKQKERQWRCHKEHMEALQRKLLAGEIQIFDAAHRPSQCVQANDYLSREDAIAYLKSCGIKLANPNLSNKNNAVNAAGLIEPTNGKSPPQFVNGRDTKWIDTELQKLKNYSAEHGSAKAAIFFKITQKRVNDLLRKAKKEKKVASPMHWNQHQK